MSISLSPAVAELLAELIAERGPIRLAIELALALGIVAVSARWTYDAVRDRVRQRAAVRRQLAETSVDKRAPRHDRVPTPVRSQAQAD